MRNYCSNFAKIIIALLATVITVKAEYPLIIDDFVGNQTVSATINVGDPIPYAISNTFLHVGAIGGERDIYLVAESPGIFGSGVSFGNGGYQSFFGTGQGAILWDGTDGDPAVNALGLNVDLSDCDDLSLKFNAFADHPTASITFIAYTTLNDYVVYTVPLVGGVQQDYVVPLGTPTQTVGSPDNSNINAFALYIDGSQFPDLDILVYNLQIDCGDVELSEPEPRTIGFWRNKNGAATIASLIFNGINVWGTLNNLNLVDANGNPVVFASQANINTFLQGANAVNMAYMLSAQLAGMQLNVLSGKVSPLHALTGPGFPNPPGTETTITIGQLIIDANTALGLDPYTPANDPNRDYQEWLKNVLDAGNNNANGFNGYNWE